MEKSKLLRLNCLFEQAVANNDKFLEDRELFELYNEFINDGRDHIKNNMIVFPAGKAHTAN